ncbi:hypothetical protein pb186bvf_009381 [Paramecium bursaria]
MRFLKLIIRLPENIQFNFIIKINVSAFILYDQQQNSLEKSPYIIIHLQIKLICVSYLVSNFRSVIQSLEQTTTPVSIHVAQRFNPDQLFIQRDGTQKLSNIMLAIFYLLQFELLNL